MTIKMTARQIAQAELDQENSKQAVSAMKSKLKALQKAELVVENIKREISELELQIEQGDVYSL